MAEVTPIDSIASLHGKVRGNCNVHFFTSRSGKIFTRTREENYQKNQSPRQKWNSAAFAYAHRQLHAIESDPALAAQMHADYASCSRPTSSPSSSLTTLSSAKSYPTAHAWKFNTLLQEWKSAHPFKD